MQPKDFLLGLLGLAILAGGGYWYWVQTQQQMAPQEVAGGDSMMSPVLVSHVEYACDADKTITADFYAGEAMAPVEEGQPPMPTGSVALKFSDGREMNFHQTISADGARYANDDESIVFWSKGNGAFVMEGNDKTFANCTEKGDAMMEGEANSASGTMLEGTVDVNVDDGSMMVK